MADSIEKDEKLVKINKWDGNAVKNSLDDAVRKIIKDKYKYTEKAGLIDLRLFLAFVAVCFALFALLWDWLFPFPKSRNILIVCAVSYFIMMGVLQLYTQYVEGAVFFVCADEQNRKWHFSSKTKKYDDMYSLEVRMTDENRDNKSDFVKSFSNWFDDDGNLRQDLFSTDVCKLHDSLLTERKEK